MKRLVCLLLLNEIDNNEKTGLLISVNRGYLLGLEILKYSLVLMPQKPGQAPA